MRTTTKITRLKQTAVNTYLNLPYTARPSTVAEEEASMLLVDLSPTPSNIYTHYAVTPSPVPSTTSPRLSSGPYTSSASNAYPAVSLPNSNPCRRDTYFSISSSNPNHGFSSSDTYPSPFSRNASKEAILFPWNASPGSSKIVIQPAACEPVLSR